MLTIDQQLLLAKKSYDGIIAQGCAAIRDDVCKYRTEDGSKCGIGHLIADEVYNESLESKGASHIDVMTAVEKSQEILLDKEVSTDVTCTLLLRNRSETVDANFLLALQGLHDKAAEKRDQAEFLAEFKDAYNYLEQKIKEGRWTCQ